MHLKLTIKDVERIIPDTQVAAEAAARGVEVLVIEHLEAKNNSTAPNRNGLPKSNYYSNAAKDVSSFVNGSRATVEVNHPGIALHYEGGTVFPKKKALAVPIDPSVAGIWPSEAGGEMDVFWPKNATHGFLKDPETSDLLYLLLPKAVIHADKTVLPTDEQVLTAAEAAIWEAFS